jgi:hypothetical protein
MERHLSYTLPHKCVVSYNGTDIRANTLSTEASPHIEFLPVEELLPQEFPENPTAPLTPYFSTL